MPQKKSFWLPGVGGFMLWLFVCANILPFIRQDYKYGWFRSTYHFSRTQKYFALYVCQFFHGLQVYFHSLYLFVFCEFSIFSTTLQFGNKHICDPVLNTTSFLLCFYFYLSISIESDKDIKECKVKTNLIQLQPLVPGIINFSNCIFPYMD